MRQRFLAFISLLDRIAVSLRILAAAVLVAMREIGLILAFLALLPTGARAGDAVASKGELSVEDLYRAISCGAETGGECRSEIARWPKRLRGNLKVFIEDPQAGFPADKVKAVIASMRLAITEVNISGADIQIELVDTAAAPLRVHMLDAGWGDRIANSGDAVIDGAKMRATASAIELEPGSGDIARASIAVSGNIAPDIIRAAVLKALMKALGLRFAIDNPHYTGKSVFAELGHDVNTVRRQDMLALRMHYPTGCAKASDCLR
jgi:hypothetical protein